MSTQPVPAPARSAWLDPEAADVADLARILEAGRAAPRPPRAAELACGVPIYDCRSLAPQLADPARRRALMEEWHAVFEDGAGVLVLAGAWPEADVLDEVSAAFFARIEQERSSGGSGGDHFARAGANDRIWNALQKLALDAPRAFARYYANAFLAHVCTAWLGPGYQVTSQANCVNPGGAAQSPHRDYHLGFCTREQAARYPRPVHRLSAHLTLQGAVAHVDMPLQTGPTLLLPHSQKYDSGYLVAGQPGFDRLFEQERVQLPLAKGDAVFFSPALIHAAGSNRTGDVRRLANLLQVSSAFGRAMESVDRVATSLAVYPALRAAIEDGQMDLDGARHAAAACAEGYAFPTNLDTDPPLGGLAPASARALMEQALEERWSTERFGEALHARVARQRA